jgi:hypothetical protein
MQLVDLPAIERAAARRVFHPDKSIAITKPSAVAATDEERALINRHPENIYRLVLDPDGKPREDPRQLLLVGLGIIWGIAGITALVVSLAVRSSGAQNYSCQLVSSAVGTNATRGGLHVPCTMVPIPN